MRHETQKRGIIGVCATRGRRYVVRGESSEWS